MHKEAVSRTGRGAASAASFVFIGGLREFRLPSTVCRFETGIFTKSFLVMKKVKIGINL